MLSEKIIRSITKGYVDLDILHELIENGHHVIRIEFISINYISGENQLKLYLESKLINDYKKLDHFVKHDRINTKYKTFLLSIDDTRYYQFGLTAKGKIDVFTTFYWIRDKDSFDSFIGWRWKNIFFDRKIWNVPRERGIAQLGDMAKFCWQKLIKSYKAAYHQVLMDIFGKVKHTIVIISPNLSITYKAHFPISIRYGHRWFKKTQVINHGRDTSKDFKDLRANGSEK